jgi:pyruvate kinase
VTLRRRRAKIIATLGPASDDLSVLIDLVNAGVDVVRINFSHGQFEDHAKRVARIREAAKVCGRYVGILGDLSGPKIRVDRFVNGSVELKNGAQFVLDVSLDPAQGTEQVVGCAYKELPTDVEPGAVLLLNDGLIELKVTGVEGPRVITEVVTGGILSNNKGLNRRGGGLSAGALTDKDRQDIQYAAQLGVDYLAVSFPKSAADINEARELARAAGSSAWVMAKIERTEAIEHLDEIVSASDAVMVARGDLGIEVGDAQIMGLQKRIIACARAHHKPVVTATQMMESMIQNPAPTRAEVSDVANAVLDDTDAVMLSAESAVGRYPVKAVEAMANIILGAEKYQLFSGEARREQATDSVHETDRAIALAVMYTANHMDVEAIVALTESGSTPKWMSRIRSDLPIYAFTRNEQARNRVTLFRGVYPVAFDVTHTDPEILYPTIFRQLVDLKLVAPMDRIILTKGEASGEQGGTNTLKILEVRV